MTASKRFAKAVAKCRANFEKNSAAHRTGWRMWDPRTPGMNNPVNLKTGKFTNYFRALIYANGKQGCACYQVNPDNAQKLRWCGLVETKTIDGLARYFTTPFGKEYLIAAESYIKTEC